ncbi:MAG: FtsX-like permease family protein, partial [Gemmatimonadales bacterium]
AIENWLRAVTADRPEAERVLSVELEARATPNPLNRETLLAVSPILLAFGLILLAACANIASLMVARGVARQREVGIRLAVGAGRGRLVGQLVTESLLLALPAAAVGLLLAHGILVGSLGILARTMPEAFRSQLRMAPLELDFRVQVFVVLMAVGSAIVFGLLPAVQTTRTDIVRATRGEFGTDARPSRLRRVLVVGQIAVAALLVCLTGLILLGSRRAGRVDVGFETANLATLRVADRSVPRVVTFLQGRPDVQAVAAATVLPLTGGGRSVALQAEAGAAVQSASALGVSPEFFATIGVAPRSGRIFGPDEAAGDAPVVVVNQALADEWWPGRAAVDETLLLLDPARAEGGATRRAPSG